MSRLFQVPTTRAGRFIGSAVVVGVLAIGLTIGWWIRQRPKVNVLIITLDTTRFDYIGCYGDPLAATPVIDALAARGVKFERAYAPAPITLPSHATMFTGLYPPEHGLRKNGRDRLDAGIPTLATSLQERGYETGAFVASFVLDSKFGLDHGFRTYDDDMTGTSPADEALHRSRDGDVVVDKALNWLQGQTAQPFLCWVHLYDPHAPYFDHPDLFGKRFQDRPYAAEIGFVDVQVGRLLTFLKEHQLEERTLVIIVGDHGEGLGDHLERRHGQMLYNTTMQVPLVFALPGQLPQGRSVATPVSLVDLFPTILKELGVSFDARISGLSLSGLMRGEPLSPRGFYAETDGPLLESGWSPLRSFTTEKWKYIRTPIPELYDLLADPRETHNLATEEAESMSLLEAQLAEFEEGLQRREGTAVRITSEEQRRLESLGYVGTNTAPDLAQSNMKRRDIKEMIALYNDLEDARILVDEGKYEESEKRLRAIIKAAPDYELAEILLGDVFLRQRDFATAKSIYSAVLERNPDSAMAETRLGDIEEAQGRFAAAIPHYERVLLLEPDSSKLHYNLGRVLVLLGDDPAAVPHFEKALERDPGYVFALVEMGSILLRQGQLDAALKRYQTALKFDANCVPAHLNAAAILAERGRLNEVIEHLSAAAKVAPREPEIQFQLGSILAAQQKRTEAAGHLAEALRLKPDHAAAQELLNSLQPAERSPK